MDTSITKKSNKRNVHLKENNSIERKKKQDKILTL